MIILTTVLSCHFPNGNIYHFSPVHFYKLVLLAAYKLLFTSPHPETIPSHPTYPLIAYAATSVSDGIICFISLFRTFTFRNVIFTTFLLVSLSFITLFRFHFYFHNTFTFTFTLIIFTTNLLVSLSHFSPFHCRCPLQSRGREV